MQNWLIANNNNRRRPEELCWTYGSPGELQLSVTLVARICGPGFDCEMQNRIGRETRSPVPTISARLRMGFKGWCGYKSDLLVANS